MSKTLGEINFWADKQHETGANEQNHKETDLDPDLQYAYPICKH